MPPTLNGNNLNERHKELNYAVNITKTWDSKFNTLTADQQDLEILYKIDVASKFKNIQFLIDMLKSGDELYISKTLKHTWIFDDEHSAFFNPNYLHNKIFPEMSEKMKVKLLTAISMNVKNEIRLEEFCDYCFNNKRTHLGYKFLLYTSETHRIDMVKKHGLKRDNDYFQKFVGNSLKVSEYCFQNIPWTCDLFAYHVYSVAPSQYLDLFEKYQNKGVNYYYLEGKMSKRLSKDIIKNHKERLIKYPIVYLKHLSKKVYNQIDAGSSKQILETLFFDNNENFWRQNFYFKYKELINLIPYNERFDFIKQLFQKKYPNDEFETCRSFYDMDMFEMMTREQQRSWALYHINLDNGFFGKMDDYSWYKHVSFNDAFEIIKKTIHKTTDRYNRMKLLEILLETTANHDELEVLLKYFYERHINEQFKDRFIEKVLEKYNVFLFKENLWAVLNKLFHAMEVYNMQDGWDTFKLVALLYHVIHEITVPECLKTYLIHSLKIRYLKSNFKKLNEEKETVFNYFINIFIEEITKYECKQYNECIKEELRPLLTLVIDLINLFEKKITDYTIIVKYAKQDEKFKYLFAVSDSHSIKDPLHLLKTDVSFANQQISFINETFKFEERVRLNRILRKLKIYFANDAAKEWITYYMQILNGDILNNDKIFGAIYGIFTLGSKEHKMKVMETYLPQNDKIDHGKGDRKIQYIQEGICRFAGYSRPPVPIHMIISYIKGDYLKYCLPMLGMLSAHLPSPLCVSFVQCLLDKPASVQKHGIRLAFRKFDSNNLIKLVVTSWEKTKNTSLREVLFLSFYNHIDAVKDIDMKKELVEVLKKIMLTLNKDDSQRIFNRFDGSSIPRGFKGEFLECAFNVVKNLPNEDNKRKIIFYITRNIELIREEFIYEVVKNYVDTNLQDLTKKYKDCTWDLVANHMVKSTDKNLIEKKMPILKMVILKIIELWDYCGDDKVYIIREFAHDFIEIIANEAVDGFASFPKYVKAVVPCEVVLQMLTSSLPIPDIYLLFLSLKLSITVQNVIHIYKEKYEYKSIIPNNGVERKNMILHIGKEVAVLIKELVDTQLFFTTSLDNFKEILKELCSKVYYSNRDIGDFDMDHCLIFLCEGLIGLEIPETYMTAVALLPCDYSEDEYMDQYRFVLNKIKCYNNNQTKRYAYDKFCPAHKRMKYF